MTTDPRFNVNDTTDPLATDPRHGLAPGTEPGYNLNEGGSTAVAPDSSGTIHRDVTGHRDTPPPYDDRRSLGQIVSDLTSHFSELMRQEVALAKAEVSTSAKRAGKGTGMLAGAGVAGHFGILFLSLALWWVLALWFGTDDHPALGWAGLAVGVLWLIVAAILAASGRSELKKVEGVPRTTQTVSKIPSALKGEEENR